MRFLTLKTHHFSSKWDSNLFWTKTHFFNDKKAFFAIFNDLLQSQTVCYTYVTDTKHTPTP